MATSYKFASFRLDPEAEVLFRGAATTPLGRRAVAVLRVLIQQPGTLVSKDALIGAAWRDQAVEESNLPVQIAAVRRVLGEELGGDQWIETLPRRGYRYVGPAVSIDGAEAASQRHSRHGLEQVAIAVLPFTNLSGNADQQYFGDAIGNDIITALTRFRWFSVVARNSSFAFRDSSVDVREIAERLGARYVVEGSHRQVGHRIRITAQLIDATTGGHIWAERYKRDLADIFVIQDEITDSVIGAIEPELLQTEARLANAAVDVEGKTARNLVRRGVWQFHKVERESHQGPRPISLGSSARPSACRGTYLAGARVGRHRPVGLERRASHGLPRGPYGGFHRHPPR